MFVGTFMAGRSQISVVDGKLHIHRDGLTRKFVEEVEHRTFSGPYAAATGKPVLYVTERCVFELSAQGLELVEIAPGVDLERDILARMDFAPIVRSPAPMDERIFLPAPMGLRTDVLRLPLEARFIYDDDKNIMFLNFARLEVKRPDDIAAIRAQVCRVCEPLDHKVYAVVNYEGFVLDPALEDAYVEMVEDMVQRYYLGVTRFTTSAFMRAKLGDALTRRGLSPYVYETEAEAQAYLRDQFPHR